MVEEMRENVNESTNYILKMEEKVYKSNKISLDLIK